MGKDSHVCPLMPHRWEWMKSDLPLASLTILRRHKLFHVSVMGARRERADTVTELAAQVSGRRNLLEINHDVSSAILFRL